MAGTPADLTVYLDYGISNDHTYYGNGCPNGWEDGGLSGSITPCENGMTSRTSDNEEQAIGTYYHFEAASSGSGAAITTNNTNTPDTFCPLGWQLPYSGTGGDYYDKSKSWKYLFTTYNYNDDAQGRAGLMSYPISNIKSGMFIWNMGRLYFLNSRIDAWTATVINSGAAFEIRNARPAVEDRKTIGMEVRCVKNLASFFRFA